MKIKSREKENSAKRAASVRRTLRKDMKANWSLYLMAVPVLAYYILFSYKPMYGALMAFFNYKPARGFSGSEFVGLQNFIEFFKSPFFARTIKNTLAISVLNLIFCFPAPIILALLLNEVRNAKFKKVVQTVTYIPHFISLVIVCGMVSQFCLSSGLINDIIEFFGGTRVALLQNPKYYRTIYILSDIWQQVGWSSIIYLAALSGVDKNLYEAAELDGANKWKQTLHVTLPGILPIIVIQFILAVGNLMSVGYEKTILLYNPTTYSVADVISSYTYRMGLVDNDWGYSTAVGLFNSVVNCILLVFTNKMSKKLTENSLW